uniref:Retrovirus-related Pol polyprotein from transposon TNT 1-94 n=1 Tax=Tanacetum cinerariifolium TaxID=118510 RepID=A0A699HJC8_TANCI|nr:hypothetical protein [Tanacetum cinerariifolium]
MKIDGMWSRYGVRTMVIRGYGGGGDMVFWYTTAYDLTAKAHPFMIDNQNDQISKRPLSFYHVIKLDATLGNLKFANKGTKDLVFGMPILEVMLNNEIKIYDDYSLYLAVYKGSKPVKATCRGSDVTLEVPDELTFKSSNNGAGVTLKVIEEQVTKKQAGEEEYGNGQGATKVSSNLTLSSVEFVSQFINDNPDVTINEVLKDLVEFEVQSMVDVPVTQAKPAKQVTRLEKKVHAMSNFNIPNAIDKLVKAHFKKVLPVDVPNISKIKMVKADKKSMPKYSSKPFDQASFDEFDQKEKRRDDQDQDPPTNVDKESKKKKRKDFNAPFSKKTKDQPTSSKKGTTLSKPSKSDKSMQAKETVKELDQEEAMDDEELAIDEVINTKEHPQDDADLVEFNDLMGSTIDFSYFIKYRPKKDKITKADLEGPIFKLLKGTYRSSIKLKYHLEQRYLAFFDQLDWTNLEGDRYDLSKPLPLQGPPGHLTILVEFFFNNDLEYLKNENKERKYVASVTKTKATRYLKEIVVRREDLNEYSFREANFSRLHLNDIEELLLLYVQRKIYNLTGDEIVHLVNALYIFTRSIVIQRRVEDMKLGVESYKKNLNITKPQTTCNGISFKEPYIRFHKLKEVFYLTKRKQKRLMRLDELYKFSDGTL